MEPIYFLWLALAYAPAVLVWIIQNSQIQRLRMEHRRLGDQLLQQRDHIESLENRYGNLRGFERESQIMRQRHA